MTIKQKYSASFTTGGLLFKETNSLLPLLAAENATELIEKEKKENQYLQINSEAARGRKAPMLLHGHSPS